MSSSFRRGTVRRNHNPKSFSSESFPGSSPASRPSRPTRTHAVFERVGTKPWTGGLTLTSSGLREWDAILGGGQPLGTAILMEEDRWTQDLALALVRYWSAEVRLMLNCTNISLLHITIEAKFSPCYKLIYCTLGCCTGSDPSTHLHHSKR